MKRPWKSVVLELLIWTAIAITTAVVLILLSDEVLPANF